mgnify:CR=1 FL=1
MVFRLTSITTTAFPSSFPDDAEREKLTVLHRKQQQAGLSRQEEASDPPVSSGVRHNCLGLRLRGGGFFQMPLRL